MSLYKRNFREGQNTTWVTAGRSFPRARTTSGSSNLVSTDDGSTDSAGRDNRETATFGSCIFCLGIMLVTVIIVVYLALGQHSALLKPPTVPLEVLTAVTFDKRSPRRTTYFNKTPSASSAVQVTEETATPPNTTETLTTMSSTPVSTVHRTHSVTTATTALSTKTPTTAVATTPSPSKSSTTSSKSTTRKTTTTSATTTTPKSNECVTRDCKAITTGLVRMLRRQVDPCRFYNTYVCDASEQDLLFPPRPARILQIAHAKAAALSGGRGKSAGAPLGSPDERIKTTYDALKQLCLSYGDVTDAELGDVLAFLSVLKLNLTGMRDSAEEDPLARAMQISLEFGVQSLLSFQRVFEYIVDASEPFRLEISVSASVRDFASDWIQVNRDVWPKFFEYCLSLCGLPIGSRHSKGLRDELISLDAEVADIMSARTDPVTKETYLDSPSVFTIDEMAAYTENTVSTDHWRQLLTEHARTEFVLHESLLAYPRALRLADLLSHPRRRLSMRRLVSWHLFLFMLGPKRAVLQAYQDATYDAVKLPGHLAETSVGRCETMLIHTTGVRGALLSLFDGTANISYGGIMKAGNLMASIQNAAASVLQPNGSTALRRLPVRRVTGFPQSAWSSGHFAPFWVLEELGAGFLKDWLSTLRSWHALPPIVQAHLLLVAGVVPVDGYFYKYFLPPHFYQDGLVVYNFAALGQIIAHGLARHVVEDLPEAYMEKWDGYWARNDITSINYMYCLHATNNTVESELPIARLQESALKGGVLTHLVATRLAFLAFVESPAQDHGNQEQFLPHVDLPPAVLFFVFHCSYSCRRGDSALLYPRGDDCMVVFRWTSRFTDLIPCGRDTKRQSRTVCRYV